MECSKHQCLTFWTKKSNQHSRLNTEKGWSTCTQLKWAKCIGTSNLLQTTAAEINSDEKILPREARVKLSWIRSGYSTVLNSYNSRINIIVPDQCELCKTGPHDFHHLFYCPNNKTYLTEHSLWNQPVEAAAFLKLTENEHEKRQSNWSIENTRPADRNRRKPVVVAGDLSESHQSTKTTDCQWAAEQ